MAEKDLEMRRMNADATYTIYNPLTKATNVKMNDGTSVETKVMGHLAEIATETELGHVKQGERVTITQDGRISADEQGYSMLSQIVLDISTPELEFEINEHFDDIKIICKNVKTTTSTTPLIVSFNNDQTQSNYTRHSYRFNNTVGYNNNNGAGFYTCGANMLSTSYDSYYFIHVLNTEKPFVQYWASGDTSLQTGEGNALYVSEIHSIRLASGNPVRPLAAGSIFEIWGR